MDRQFELVDIVSQVYRNALINHFVSSLVYELSTGSSTGSQIQIDEDLNNLELELVKFITPDDKMFAYFYPIHQLLNGVSKAKKLGSNTITATEFMMSKEECIKSFKNYLISVKEK